MVYSADMSGSVYGGDEVGAVCFDFGSHTVRAGFAGEDAPKANVPTHMLTGDEKTKYHVGTNAIMYPREKSEVVTPIKDGMIDNWDQYETMMDHLYSKCLSVESSEHPIMMSEVAWNKMEKRHKTCEIMLEKYNAPAFYLCKNAVLAAFASGRSTALVLDSGAAQTTAVPVHDGYVIQHGVVRSPLAGNFLAAQVREHLKDQSIEVVPTYKIASKEPVKEGQTPIWTLRKNIPNVSSTWHDYQVDQVIEDLIHHVLQVHDKPATEEELNMIPGSVFEFPNGYNHLFGSERFKVPEPLFDPLGTNLRILGGDMLAAQHVLSSSISMCDIDVRPGLWSNIVLAGGTTLLTGFSERLTTECHAKMTSSTKVKVVTGGNTTDRIFSAWVGASILASLGTFQELWISKQEYEEEGKLIVDKKCP